MWEVRSSIVHIIFFWAFGGVSSIYAVSVSKRTADKLKLLPEDIEWRLGWGGGSWVASFLMGILSLNGIGSFGIGLRGGPS